MDDQAGLCLSCGVPFLPDLSKIEFFNRNGVLSIVFLQSEFINNPTIRELYNVPKFSSEKHAAHIFHESHHGTALHYMCTRHTDDNAVGLGVIHAPGAPVGNIQNAPFLYFRVPTSSNKQAHAAQWARPPRNTRLGMGSLKKYIRESLNFASCRPVGHNLGQTFGACVGCNSIMTQLADFRYVVGYKTTGTRNPAPILTGGLQPILQYSMTTNNAPLDDNAYNSWTVAANPNQTAHPAMNDTDHDAPHIAYYLHLCLPFQQPGAVNYFRRITGNPILSRECRTLYLEQCWLILEIACIATLLEQGNVTLPNGKLSHGVHQHLGVLDLYVSFFMYRLIEFRFGARLRLQGVNFVQWHQKYYCDALNCRDLFRRRENSGVIGQKMYTTTDQASRQLVTQICTRMVRALEVRWMPLIMHVIGMPDVPRGIREYFVPTETLRVLVRRSRQVRRVFLLNVFLSIDCNAQVVSTDFQEALSKFGINALLHRITRLCADYPSEFTNQLMDFRANWQMVEIDRVQKKGIPFSTAYQLYQLCMIMYAPLEEPLSKDVADALFEHANYCSYWNAVLALDEIGALRDTQF